MHRARAKRFRPSPTSRYRLSSVIRTNIHCLGDMGPGRADQDDSFRRRGLSVIPSTTVMSITEIPARVPKLGVLQLKTTFPRPPGDVGNAASWGDIPVVIRVVEEADSETVVGGTWGTELVDAFVREGERLIREEGCVAFVTSCGFVSAVRPASGRAARGQAETDRNGDRPG